MWGCLAKVMLPEPKRKKIGSKTSDCIFIGYAEHSAAYRFLVLKSEVLDCNTIIETKNAEFFEHNFPLKSENISEASTQNSLNDSNEELRRSKRQRKETSFGNDFYTYLVDNDPIKISEAFASAEASFWKEAVKSEFDSISNCNTWVLVDLPPGAKAIGCK